MKAGTPEATALVALALQPQAMEQAWAWYAHDLLSWAPELRTVEGTAQAILALRNAGLVRLARPSERQRNTRELSFVLTDEGRAGAAAAKAAKDRPAGARSSPFATRVWALLRVRRMLTPREAAETLTDVGDPAELERARRQAREWLRAWTITHPDVVQQSRQLVGGDQRFVLVRDAGIKPPESKLRPNRPSQRKVAAA